MAAELVGGALLSAFLQAAFERLASREFLDLFRRRKLDKTLLKKLNTMLLYIDAVADDAELKQFRDPHVKAWLDSVKDAVFDADDLLDEIDTLVSKSNLMEMESESQTCTSKVRNLFPARASSFEKDTEPRMKQVLDNLEYLASKKDILGLKETSGHGVGSMPQKLPTTSLLRESVIYGRDADKEIVFNWLISNAQNDDLLSVVSIVGMGGVGKTTLAQHLYNDPRMEGRFNLKAWVCFADEFNVFNVSRAILEAFTKSADDSRDLEMLHGRLKEKLTGKRFLLVLDDVWNENRDLWEALQTPLNYGSKGSKILVTTRNKVVALTMRASKMHFLEQLQEKHCWRLFAKHAFLDENPQLDTSLKVISMKIVNKCKGLPLALKTLGSLLHTKPSVSEWENILTSEIWEIPEKDSNIIPALLLSYHHLPFHLKRCFAYCSLFPKDYKFKKEHLIQLWMAENFLKCPQNGKSMEALGEQYFDDLLLRSFFQQYDEKSFVMHDLLNDLAKYVSGDFCVRLEGEEIQNIPKTTRHASLRGYHEKKFQQSKDCNKLRTFLSLDGSSNIVINELFFRCKFLRVLCLTSNRNVEKFSGSIGNLKHLRYLDLSCTHIKMLPHSLCLLYNLQILKLKDCRYLEELPSELHKLTNLRYLDLRGTEMRKMPMLLGKLKNLQVLKLTSFSVGKGSKFGIQWLAELNLHGELKICELQNIVNPLDASEANLRNKIHLVELGLEWSGECDDSLKLKQVLEKLQPSKNLKRLKINYYGGTLFPDWIGDSSFSNMLSLKLKNCENCTLLPSFGLLPSLEDLSIVGLHRIEVIGEEFYGTSSSSSSSSTIPFASLETLVFEDMEGWEEWECKTGAFPRLRKLHIENCPELRGHLPEKLPCLSELHIRYCPQLVASIPRSSAIPKLELKDCQKVKLDYLPHSMVSLKILGGSLEGSLFERIGHTISDMSLETFQGFNFPNESIPIHHRYSSLAVLYIRSNCIPLKTFPLNFFPKLEQLCLEGCHNLESISSQRQHAHHQNLVSLTIRRCPKFESFPSGGLCAPKLKWFELLELEKLKSLPECMHIHLLSLYQLKIFYCPQVEFLSGGCFPSNLKMLYLSECSKLIPTLKGAFGPNSSLKELNIKEMEMESFPDEGLLPVSLTSLSIRNCPDLQKLDGKGLCHLSSLKELSLTHCPELKCLPEEGLPKSISSLFIGGSYSLLLKRRCHKPNGQDWPKIAHIKDVCIS